MGTLCGYRCLPTRRCSPRLVGREQRMADRSLRSREGAQSNFGAVDQRVRGDHWLGPLSGPPATGAVCNAWTHRIGNAPRGLEIFDAKGDGVGWCARARSILPLVGGWL